MRQQGWRVGFPICFWLGVALGSVGPSFMQWGWLHSYFVEWGSFSVIECFIMLSNCVYILLEVNFEAFYGFWGYSKFLLLSFHKFLVPQRHFASKMDITVLSSWVGLWVRTNHRCWGSMLLSLWKKRDAAEYICKCVHVSLIHKVTH